MATVAFDSDIAHRASCLFVSASTYGTATLSDFRDGVQSAPLIVLVRIFGELCLVGLMVASMVEGVARMILAVAFIPVALLICDFDNSLSNWWAETAVISIANAFYIAFGALVQNIVYRKLGLYPDEIPADVRRDMHGYALSLTAMRSVDVLIIPEASSNLDVPREFEGWIAILNSEYHLLSDTDDDGRAMQAYDAIGRWNETIRDYQTLSTAQKRRFMNALHHLAIYIKREWDQHVAPIVSADDKEMIKLHLRKPERGAVPISIEALTVQQREAARVLRNAKEIVRQLIAAFGHCTNRQGTTVERLYRKFVLNDPKALEEETIGHGMRLALAEMRDQIFNDAMDEILRSGGDAASTDNYYRRTQGERFGVASDVSRVDMNHAGSARQGQEAVIERHFDEKYTLPAIVTHLRERLSNLKETLFPSGRFLTWIRENYQPEQVAQAFDQDNKFTPRIILEFLATERVAVHRQA